MRNKRQIVSIFSILILALVAACAPAAAPAPQAPAPAAAPAPQPAAAAAMPAAPARPAWEVELERTAQAAKKEGTVALLTTTGPETRRAVAEAFKSKYGIGIEWLAGSGAELGVKIVNERRARIYSVDAAIIGFSAPWDILRPAGALDSLDKMLLLPETTDPAEIKKVWRFGKLEWVDKAHTMLSFSHAVNYGAVINTDVVKPGEIQAFRDLLNPKWKDKIAMYDITMSTGPGSSWVQPVGSYIMGWDYLRKLAEQEPVITRDARLLAEWVAHGKYPIGIAIRSELTRNLMDMGAPVKGLKLEEGAYTTAGPNTITLIKDTPHPNAIKLFINWLLSKEGQIVYCKTYGSPSGRLDVTIPGLDPLLIPDPKMNYTRTDSEEALTAREDAVKKATEIFGRLRK